MNNTFWRSPALILLWIAAIACDENPSIQPDPGSGVTDADASVETDANAQDVDKQDAVDAKDQEAGDAMAHQCPENLPGPAMVAVPSPNGDWYCIDATEVTQGQYHDFLKAKGANPEDWTKGDTSGQPSECSWNEDYYPPLVLQEGEPCNDNVLALDRLNKHPDYPVACVDWCDARAFCEWAGKRLCGRVGGGNNEWSSSDVATKSEWYNACSQGGKTAYPYGDTFEPGTCGDTEAYEQNLSQGMTEDQARKTTPDTCHGTMAPFDEVFQMSGSVAEWEESCDLEREPPACLVRGGWKYQPPQDEVLRCDGSFTQSLDRCHPFFGFRCCE